MGKIGPNDRKWPRKPVDHPPAYGKVEGVKVKERQTLLDPKRNRCEQRGVINIANLSDEIEQYLKEHLRRSQIIELQRVMLAAQFACAPSQINYVLTTRFTPERGYLVESRRGGGGFIRIIRLNVEDSNWLYDLAHRQIGDAVSQSEALDVIFRLREQEVIDDREAALMQAVVQRETIRVDLPLRDQLRASLLKSMILAILRF